MARQRDGGRMRRVHVVKCVAVFAVCLSIRAWTPYPAAADDAGQQVVVTGLATTADGRCSPRRVGQLVVDFLSTQQRGAVQLSRYIAPRPVFHWYSDNVTNG